MIKGMVASGAFQIDLILVQSSSLRCSNQAVLRYNPQHHGDNDAKAANAHNHGMKHIVIANDLEVHIGVETAIDGVQLRIIGDGKLDLDCCSAQSRNDRPHPSPNATPLQRRRWGAGGNRHHVFPS